MSYMGAKIKRTKPHSKKPLNPPTYKTAKKTNCAKNGIDANFLELF